MAARIKELARSNPSITVLKQLLDEFVADLLVRKGLQGIHRTDWPQPYGKGNHGSRAALSLSPHTSALDKWEEKSALYNLDADQPAATTADIESLRQKLLSSSSSTASWKEGTPLTGGARVVQKKIIQEGAAAASGGAYV